MSCVTKAWSNEHFVPYTLPLNTLKFDLKDKNEVLQYNFVLCIDEFHLQVWIFKS